jgi:hypothetical protein
VPQQQEGQCGIRRQQLAHRRSTVAATVAGTIAATVAVAAVCAHPIMVLARLLAHQCHQKVQSAHCQSPPRFGHLSSTDAVLVLLVLLAQLMLQPAAPQQQQQLRAAEIVQGVLPPPARRQQRHQHLQHS